jgi:SAM-dependent methyltransferase
MPSALRGRSDRLRAFVEEAPLERASILEFVASQARTLAPGARVLDVGAGDAPYRELFEAQRYTTLDRAETLHNGPIDLPAGAESIPLAAGSIDAVLCTQVLEHVRDPLAVLRELRRILVPGGILIATVPFVWEEHELPSDFFRFTKQGVEHLLAAAAFGEADVRPRTDCFTTLAQLVRNAGWAMGTAADGLDPLRVQARAALEEMAAALTMLAPLDVKMILPLGYSVSARAIKRPRVP